MSDDLVKVKTPSVSNHLMTDSLGSAKAFTLSDDEALTLSLLDQVKGQAVSESAIKNALHPDAISATDRRAKYAGLEAYEAEGGTVTRDLVETQGWAWAEARHEAWLNHYELDQMKL